MGDLYPIIEGPVKFRDGKKVFFHTLKIMMNTYFGKKRIHAIVFESQISF